MIHVFLLRELHAALVNRFLIVFGVLMLALGSLPFLLAGADATETAAHMLLLGSLYLVPLFAVLAGAASARTDWSPGRRMRPWPVRAGALERLARG